MFLPALRVFLLLVFGTENWVNGFGVTALMVEFLSDTRATANAHGSEIMFFFFLVIFLSYAMAPRLALLHYFACGKLSE